MGRRREENLFHESGFRINVRDCIYSKSKKAIRDYLEILKTAKNLTVLYNLGGTEHVGNLKGLWRFKDKSFKDFRIHGTVEKSVLVITVLAVETRNDA